MIASVQLPLQNLALRGEELSTALWLAVGLIAGFLLAVALASIAAACMTDQRSQFL